MLARFTTAAALLLIAAAPAQAQSGAAQGGEPDYLALGAGWNPDYVGSDEYRIIPFGAFKLTTPVADVRSSGLAVTADILAPYQRDRAVRVEFGPQVNYRFGRKRDDVEDAVVLALGEIDDAVEVGATLGVVFDDVTATGDSFALRAEALRDTSAVYDGSTYGLEATYTFATPRDWGVNIVANTQYGDDRFHDRYFDVTAAQSMASGLPQYDAEAGFYQVAVGANIRKNLTERFFVAGQFVAAQLIGDVADSPIVDLRGSATQFRGGVTLGFTF